MLVVRTLEFFKVKITELLFTTDNKGMFWEESLFLAHEGYEFLCVYESSEEEKEESVVTPVQLANACIASMSEYFKHHDQLPTVNMTHFSKHSFG